MALFSNDTLAEVFWEGQNSTYTPWWGESRFTNEMVEKEGEVYMWPYPVRLEEVNEYGEHIQWYLIEKHDVEEAIIKYADQRSDTLMDWIDNMDVVICDDILQLAAFKEIRYA